MLSMLRRFAPSARLARVGALTLLAAAPPLAGQAGTGNGFLIGTPTSSLTIRGGWALAAAHSDVFAFTTSQLTLDRGDFSAPDLGADLAFRLAKRTDVVISTSIAATQKKSEFRRFIDTNDQPIEQQTQFFRVPITASLKQYLTDRGRSIGTLAWVPARVAPYVGLGAGVMWYKLRQDGDFVDFQTMDVFSAVLESTGFSPTAHAFVGAEFSVSPRFSIVTDARYVASRAKLGHDFAEFKPIDLSGFSTTAGFTVRF